MLRKSVVKKRMIAVVPALTLLTIAAALALASSPAGATTSAAGKKPPAQPPATKRCYGRHGQVPCKKSTPTTTTVTGTAPAGTTAKSTKTTPGKTNPTAPVDKATMYDGQYAGTETGHARVVAPSGSGVAPIDKGGTSAIHFTVSHGVLTLGLGHYQVSNLGQASVFVRAPGLAGSIGGTLFFVLAANGAVNVHGVIQGTLSGHGIVTTSIESITASRISR